MSLRARHGRARKGAGPVVEVRPPDELPSVPAGAAAPLVARDARGRIVDSASARAMASMPRGSAFVMREVRVHASFKPHERRRREWLRRRRAELAALTGAVSHAVGAMLSAAAWMHAAAEFAAERAAREGDAEGFRTAATYSATARQHDLAAWELAVREADARGKAHRAPATPALLARAAQLSASVEHTNSGAVVDGVGDDQRHSSSYSSAPSTPPPEPTGSQDRVQRSDRFTGSRDRIANGARR